VSGLLLRRCALGSRCRCPHPPSPSRPRVIILRHAEKLNKHELCEIGSRRPRDGGSVSRQRRAASLFASARSGGDSRRHDSLARDDFATAQSWELPAVVYSVLPSDR